MITTCGANWNLVDWKPYDEQRHFRQAIFRLWVAENVDPRFLRVGLPADLALGLIKFIFVIISLWNRSCYVFQ